jgi:hypothetical protein
MKQYRAVCLIKGLKGKYLEIGACVDLDEAAARPFLKSGSLVPADPVPAAPAPPASQPDGPPAPEPKNEAPPARKPGRPSKAGARS